MPDCYWNKMISGPIFKIVIDIESIHILKFWLKLEENCDVVTRIAMGQTQCEVLIDRSKHHKHHVW